RGVPLGATSAQQLLDSGAYFARAALEKDPNYGDARGVLATYFFVSAFRGFRPFVAYMDSAHAAASSALARDSALIDAWTPLISEAMYLDDDWAQAQHLVERALHFGGTH